MKAQKSKPTSESVLMQHALHSHRNNFDALRLLLAFLVLLSHGRAIFDLPLHYGIFYQAEQAVNGFFIISGFLISWSIDRHFDVRSYTLKRLMRIYPLYLFVITAQLILLTGFNEQANSLREMAHYYAVNLVTLNFLKPTFGTMVSEPINGSLWTIKIELMFYATIPLYIWLLRRYGLPFLCLSFACAFAYRFGLEAMDQIRWARQIPGSMTFFIAGATAYFYGPRLIRYLATPSNRRWLLLALFLTTMLALVLSQNFYAQQLAYVLGMTIGLYMVAFYLPHLPVPVDISYGVYLWHVPVFLTLRHLYGDTAAPYSLYLGGTLLILLLSWLSARWIEIPCIQWAGRTARSWRTKARDKES